MIIDKYSRLTVCLFFGVVVVVFVVFQAWQWFRLQQRCNRFTTIHGFLVVGRTIIYNFDYKFGGFGLYVYICRKTV